MLENVFIRDLQEMLLMVVLWKCILTLTVVPADAAVEDAAADDSDDDSEDCL